MTDPLDRSTDSDKEPFLTVVIPAYNESARIVPTLEAVRDYLDAKPWTFEVLVVDDGSGDDTAAVVEAFASGAAGFRLLKNPGNRGKGYAVRHGMLEGRGRYLLFSDADLSTPIEECGKILRALRGGAGVAVASRRLGASDLAVKQPWYRELMGRTFNLVVQLFAVRGITDTQCGFKGFTRAAARAVFEPALLERFGFDVEVLFLARRLGFPIAEVPVRWIDSPDSRIDPLRDPLRMFLEVLQVRRNAWEGKYRAEGALGNRK